MAELNGKFTSWVIGTFSILLIAAISWITFRIDRIESTVFAMAQQQSTHTAFLKRLDETSQFVSAEQMARTRRFGDIDTKLQMIELKQSITGDRFNVFTDRVNDTNRRIDDLVMLLDRKLKLGSGPIK